MLNYGCNIELFKLNLVDYFNFILKILKEFFEPKLPLSIASGFCFHIIAITRNRPHDFNSFFICGIGQIDLQ